MDQGNFGGFKVHTQDQSLRPDPGTYVLEPGTGTAPQVQHPLPPTDKSIFFINSLQLVDRPGHKTLGSSLSPVRISHPGSGHTFHPYPIKYIDFLLTQDVWHGNNIPKARSRQYIDEKDEL
jgi:hypothetical protein